MKTKEQLENGCGFKDTYSKNSLCQKGNLCSECKNNLDYYNQGREEKEKELIKEFKTEGYRKRIFNFGYNQAKQELQSKIMKEIDKRIERHEHCRDTCESQELDEVEILKQNIKKLFEEEK